MYAPNWSSLAHTACPVEQRPTTQQLIAVRSLTTLKHLLRSSFQPCYYYSIYISAVTCYSLDSILGDGQNVSHRPATKSTKSSQQSYTRTLSTLVLFHRCHGTVGQDYQRSYSRLNYHMCDLVATSSAILSWNQGSILINRSLIGPASGGMENYFYSNRGMIWP